MEKTERQKDLELEYLMKAEQHFQVFLVSIKRTLK